MSSSSDADASFGAIPPPVVLPDAMHSLCAAEIGLALGGLSEEEVCKREQAGKLFSVIRRQGSLQREYPAFQVWPSVINAGLADVLNLLQPLCSADIYGFFAGKDDLLDGLTPVETLMGQLARPRLMGRGAEALLRSAPSRRLEAVLATAQAHVALRVG